MVDPCKRKKLWKLLMCKILNDWKTRWKIQIWNSWSLLKVFKVELTAWANSQEIHVIIIIIIINNNNNNNN